MATSMILRFALKRNISKPFLVCSRNLLSQNYKCDEAWKEQLSNDVLQKFEPYGFALKLMENVDKSSVTAVDMDILANRLNKLDHHQLEFAQEVFYKFRHTKQTIHSLESTSHAFIRAFVEFGEIEKLMEVLKNKVHYGIFLDDYTSNFLMDYFIKQNKFKEAGEIACEMMLQENLFNPITRSLAWYATHKRLHEILAASKSAESKDGIVLNDLNDPLPAVDEDDIKFRKVRILLEPWYDDHFDIPTEHQRLGKTLVLVSRHEQIDQSENILTRSYHLIGYGFHRKFEQGFELMHHWLTTDTEDVVYDSQIELFKSLLEGVKAQESRALPEPGLRTIQHLYPYITPEQKSDYQSTFKELEGKLRAAGKIAAGSQAEVESKLTNHVQEMIKKFEADDVTQLKQLYKSWASERQQLLSKQVKEVERENKKQELADRLLSLKRREEKLRYFDEKIKMELSISERPVVEVIEEKVEEEQFVAPPGERGKSGADAMKKKK